MPTQIEALLTARNEMMREIKKDAKMEDIVTNYVKHKVSRQYKEVVKRAVDIRPDLQGIEIIWGEGGAQTKRINEYKKNNTFYLHVSSKLLN